MMKNLRDFVQWQTVRGQAVRQGTTSVIPVAQSLVVRLPFGGLAWSRPLAVEVQEPGVPVQRIAIVDVTRIAQLSLLISVASLRIILWLIGRE